MTASDLTVEGRRFRNRSDYEAALRDQKKIKQIKAKTNLDSPKQIFKLLSELQGGVYRFETALGTDFDDEIFERAEALKKKGITAENAEEAGKKKKKAHGTVKQASGGKVTGKKEKPPGLKIDMNDKEMQKQVKIELRKREKRRRFIMVTASVVAVACFGYFGIYSFYAVRTGISYESLAEMKNNKSGNPYPVYSNTVQIHRTSDELPDVLEEYQTLYLKNKKLIGWLKIDDTIIDYPVMQTGDNEYYLDHNFNQEYDKNGSLFLDYNCNIYPRSTNLIIYGHHMKSGQMFGQLQKYAKESYGEKHSIIRFDSIYEEAEYQVMYVFRSQVYNEDEFVFKYYQFIDANSEEEFNSYMEEMAGLSLYDTGVTASYGDSLLTLSTCDNSQTDGRFVVVAKRIK